MNKQVQGLTKIETIRGLLEKMKPEIQKVLPKHLDPARIIRMALTDFQTVKHLNECTAESFLGALMECSQLGLEPGRVLGQAYLLPFKNKTGQYICRMIPGYQGLCAIARRSGEIKVIYARAVFENDKFDYWYGLDEGLEHKPYMGDRGELTYVYAVARLTSGEIQFEVMDAAEIEAIRQRSRAADDGPWMTDKIEMSKKTCLRRLCKNLPSSIELRETIALENEDHQEPVDISNFDEDLKRTHNEVATMYNPSEVKKPYVLKSRQATPEEAEEIWSRDRQEEHSHESQGENKDASYDSSRAGRDDENPIGRTGQENPQRSNKTNDSTSSKSVQKDYESTKKSKELTQLRMKIQDQLFHAIPSGPGDADVIVEENLKKVSMKTKCGQGYLFLTVADLATCENIAWMREISDSLEQMQ